MPYIGNITQDFNVSNAMLDTDSVTSIKIVDGTIEGADIAANLDLSDSQKIRFGAGNDLQIYHDGTNSYIKNLTGYLNVNANLLYLGNQANNETYILAQQNGSVDLFYDNSKKFETVSSGAKVTGELTLTNHLFLTTDNTSIRIGADQDLQMWHDGNNGFLSSYTGNLNLYINGNEKALVAYPNAAVELYYDNSKKFETQSAGVEITGKLTFATEGLANGSIDLGIDADLNLYHDNSDAFIDNNTGDFYIRNDGNSTSEKIRIQAKGGEQSIIASPNGAVELYYDNSKKFETAAGGVVIPSGANNCLRIFGSNATHATSALIIGQNNNTTSQLRAYGPDASTNGRIELRSSRSDASNTKNIFYDSGNLEFPDSQKAVFGDGDDLQIYHDGSNSHIAETGTGVLKISGSAGVYINKHDNSETMAAFLHDAAVELYFNNSKKLETTSGGVTVSSTLGIANVGGTLAGSGGTENWMGIKDSADNFQFAVKTHGTNNGSVGIGTTSPSAKLDIGGLTNTGGENVDALKVTRTDGIQLFGINWNVSANEVSFSGNTKNYVFKNKSSSAESIRFPATGGITFNGDTAAANALDDYEEGTWTPTATTNAGGAFSSSYVRGYYIKVGRKVSAWFNFESYGNQGSDMYGSNQSAQVVFGGLPFASVSGSHQFYHGDMAAWAINYPGSLGTAVGDIYCYQNADTTNFEPHYTGDNASGTAINAGAFGQAYVRGCLHYYTS